MKIKKVTLSFLCSIGLLLFGPSQVAMVNAVVTPSPKDQTAKVEKRAEMPYTTDEPLIFDEFKKKHYKPLVYKDFSKHQPNVYNVYNTEKDSYSNISLKSSEVRDIAYATSIKKAEKLLKSYKYSNITTYLFKDNYQLENDIEDKHISYDIEVKSKTYQLNDLTASISDQKEAESLISSLLEIFFKDDLSENHKNEIIEYWLKICEGFIVTFKDPRKIGGLIAAALIQGPTWTISYIVLKKLIKRTKDKLRKDKKDDAARHLSILDNKYISKIEKCLKGKKMMIRELSICTEIPQETLRKAISILRDYNFVDRDGYKYYLS